MEKVYLLLRKGHQSGPFTFGELLQQQLLPTDMVWIENSSSAWSYVSEMEFKPVVVAKTPSSSPVLNSQSPGDEIERKAEELRQRALSYVPKSLHQVRPLHQQVNAAKTQFEDDADVHFVDHRKDKKSFMHELVISAVIIGIFASVLYGSRSYLNNNKDQLNTVANKIESTDHHSAIANTDSLKTKETTVGDTSHAINDIIVVDSLAVPVIEKLKPLPVAKTVARKSIPVKKLPVVMLPAIEDQTITSVTTPPVEDATTKEIIPVEVIKTPAVEKKKTVGQAIRGLFKKKKKENGQPLEQ